MISRLPVVLMSAWLLTLTGCATAPSVDSAFEDAVDASTLDEDENRFWLMSDQMDESLRNQNALYGDEELDAYLQELIDTLFPEFVGKIRIHAIKDAGLNAFAMANGSLYINTGMLARLNSEAELAAVLGHEGVHFTDRHVIQGIRKQKATNIFVNVVAMSGYGLAGSLMGVSSVMGYSQATETHADIRGFTRVRDAGYNVKEIGDSFRRFAREIEARDIKGNWFFATHPKMTERAEAFEKLARTVPEGGDSFEDRFLSVTTPARMDALASLAEKSEAEALIHILDTEGRLHLFPDEAKFYLGEAYRQRNEDDDMTRAEELYVALTDESVEYAPAFGRLGFLQMQRNENDAALLNFRRYLDLEPDAKDKAYIENYIETITGAQQ